jgi:glycosyltransferase involved in cell wall biosynthesis
MHREKLDISAVIITYNEEKNIRRCLESLRWAREIVVIDSYSSDKTVEIAREYTNQVFLHPFEGYVKQKNYALDRASSEWVFSLDADEVVTQKLWDRIQKSWPQEKVAYDGFTVNRLSQFSGKWIRHCGWYPDKKLRLFRRQRGRWTGNDLHEKVQVEGRVKDLNADLRHYAYENLAENMEKIQRYSTIFAKAQYKRGRRASCFDLLMRPVAKFFKAYILKRGFLDGRHGFLLTSMASFYVFLKYAKLWELQRKGDEG